MGFTEKDKINHYVNNLAQHKEFGDLKDLYHRVEKVKDKQDFKEFCVKKFDEGEREIGVLYLYFNKKLGPKNKASTV